MGWDRVQGPFELDCEGRGQQTCLGSTVSSKEAHCTQCGHGTGWPWGGLGTDTALAVVGG